ncbi:MAG: hypothetical protein JXA18_12755 [Chitinispirillaceae bacterium]|nr:hypothetical protein [Chitinispirillaceae bacterium]
MIRTATVVTAALLAFAFSVTAKRYSLSVQKGGAEIVRGETGEQVIAIDTATVTPNDMISLSEGQQATVSIEKKAAVLIKGPASLSLSEQGNTLTIALDDGQILLSRKQPYEYSAVTIAAEEFSFIPVGTVAAVKTSSGARPTTAVVEGKMRMQAPSGEAVVIEEGNFGNVGPDGKLTTGPLSPRAIESLREWLAQAPALGSTGSEADAPASAPGGSAVQSTEPPADSPPEAADKPAGPSPDAASVTGQKTETATPAEPPAVPAADVAAAAAPEAEKAADATVEKASETEKKEEKPGARKIDKTPPPPSTPKWEISAGTATVNDEQWTRLALGVDVPIWKFGVFFDVELFIDNDGQFSDKGWNFRDDWLEALTRKIRYIRFGQEGELLFVKLGGLSSVSLGYGFLVDRFTNMLHYPDQRQLGLQFDLNDISPVGITLQTLVADFKDFDTDGGILAARCAFRPLKATGIPIVKGIAVGGSYATDLNQYAPARKWDFTMAGTVHDRDEDGITDSSFYYENFGNRPYYDSLKRDSRAIGDFDTIIEHRDRWASRENDPFGLIGADLSIPIITTELVGLDLYGQAGIRDDRKHGWGIGAPGVSLTVWRLWASVEYRRVQGRFQPGYFGTYYLDERLLRDPSITTKEQRLVSDTLNGVFGRLGFNIADVLLIQGDYQYMVGKHEASTDQRFEAVGSLGEMLLDKIPKLNRAEIYYYKSRIGIEDDEFFEKTPFMYFGYRVGFEIAPGATLIWDARHGYRHDENGKLVPNNNLSIQTAIMF